MLQYITNPNSETPIVQQVKQVIEGGCRWVQLRHKHATDDEIRALVEELKPICQQSDTVLILNDRVELAKELQLDGVHIGKEDMLPTQAREILGAGPIIGVTVNSAEDIAQIRYFDIDYIGMGPFRFTQTKENLSPVIGIDGYQRTMQYIHDNKIELPVVAVGGIEASDIKSLMQVGVNGIAISGAIAFSDDIIATTAQFISLLDTPNRIG